MISLGMKLAEFITANHSCNTSVLRADEAEYNEETGEIKAGKTVRVKLESTLAQ